MKLTDLEPTFLIFDDRDPSVRGTTDDIHAASGVQFVCPKCFAANENRRPGVHSIICWSPAVPQSVGPAPGRWQLLGTGYANLTLKGAKASSVLLTAGCRAHFHIRNGEIINV